MRAGLWENANGSIMDPSQFDCSEDVITCSTLEYFCCLSAFFAPYVKWRCCLMAVLVKSTATRDVVVASTAQKKRSQGAGGCPASVD